MKTDPDCIFCKIVAGEIPATKVFADDTAMAFLDVGPLAEGHVLLIPKAHYETVDQMPADVAAAILKHLPALARAVMAVTGCEGLNVLQNNGRVAHQFVPHVHFHLIPRNPGDEFHFNWPAGKYPEGRAEQLADEIKKNL
ncbi:MAG: HIT family protein [Phycisphaerae bacterium]|nr:HIT family protein [Phycisphaerae bacterium]